MNSIDDVVTVRGVVLRRRVAAGPRGGVRWIYQVAADSPTWGFWCDTARQAIREAGDCVVRP